jgi:uncharacterized LabA/DUF88 family protein
MQIDLQSLFYAARNKDKRVDFEKVWNHFHSRENEFMIDAVVYMIRSQGFDSSKFEAKLQSYGYNLRTKDVPKPTREWFTEQGIIDGNTRTDRGGFRDQVRSFKHRAYRDSKPQRRAARSPNPLEWIRRTGLGHQINLTLDCIGKADMFDKWILLSADGNFADLAKHLKSRGKTIEVWSFKEEYDSALEMQADRMQFLDDEFFYRRPKVKVFGFNWQEIE